MFHVNEEVVVDSKPPYIGRIIDFSVDISLRGMVLVGKENRHGHLVFTEWVKSERISEIPDEPEEFP